MLDLAGGVRVTCFCPESLHPGIADTVEEDDETLDELCSGNVLPVGNWDPVPCPPKFGEGTQETSERDESITPENATLNKMGEADVDVVPPASTRIDDDTGKQLHETGKNQNSFQRGENDGPDLPVPGLLVIHLRNNVVKGVIGMNGMMTSVEWTGNCGAVRGGCLGGPFDCLTTVFFVVKVDSLRRGA